MGIFDLAVKQLSREGKEKFTDLELLDRAIKIRKFLNKHPGAINGKI